MYGPTCIDLLQAREDQRDGIIYRNVFPYPKHGLLPVSRTPSLGVMMKPEVVHGDETDV